MTLSGTEIGKPVRVDAINLAENVKRRLQMLGLTRGAKVTVLRRKSNGAVIFSVRGTRYAAGKNIAKGIFVNNEPVQNEPIQNELIQSGGDLK